MQYFGFAQVWSNNLPVNEVWLLGNSTISKRPLAAFIAAGWDVEKHWRQVKFGELKQADGSSIEKFNKRVCCACAVLLCSLCSAFLYCIYS